MAEATRLQAVDPGAADALWARAERRIVDQAPAVGAYSHINTDLVSERLGNYQFSPCAGDAAGPGVGALISGARPLDRRSARRHAPA